MESDRNFWITAIIGTSLLSLSSLYLGELLPVWSWPMLAAGFWLVAVRIFGTSGALAAAAAQVGSDAQETRDAVADLLGHTEQLLKDVIRDMHAELREARGAAGYSAGALQATFDDLDDKHGRQRLLLSDMVKLKGHALEALRFEDIVGRISKHSQHGLDCVHAMVDRLQTGLDEMNDALRLEPRDLVGVVERVKSELEQIVASDAVGDWSPVGKRPVSQGGLPAL